VSLQDSIEDTHLTPLTPEQVERNLRWIKALESGCYKQGRGRLKREDHYCCLGVGCNLFMEETGYGSWEKGSDDFLLDGDSASAFPPESVADWYGWQNESPAEKSFRTTYGVVEDKTLEVSLLNDSGASFVTIADSLRAMLLLRTPPPAEGAD
jgi:hypothetical protein